MLIEDIIGAIIKVKDLKVAKMYRSLLASILGMETRPERIRYFDTEKDFNRFVKSLQKKDQEDSKLQMWTKEGYKVLIQNLGGKEYLYTCKLDESVDELDCPYTSVFVGLNMTEKGLKHPSIEKFPLDVGEGMCFYIHKQSPKCLRLAILGDTTWDDKDAMLLDRRIEKTQEFLM